jgi:hypothetical protein
MYQLLMVCDCDILEEGPSRNLFEKFCSSISLEGLKKVTVLRLLSDVLEIISSRNQLIVNKKTRSVFDGNSKLNNGQASDTESEFTYNV